MGRIDKLVSAVLIKVADQGQRKITRDDILFHMDEVSTDIAKRTLALEGTKTIHLVPNKSTYLIVPPIYKIVEIQEPNKYTNRITVLHDHNEWVGLVNGTNYSGHGSWTLSDVISLSALVQAGNLTLSASPVYAHLWGKTIEFLPVPQVVDDLKLFVYGLPGAIDPTDTDPNLPDTYDRCIRYGILNELLSGTWGNKYEVEIALRLDENRKKTIKDPERVESKFDELGW